MQLPTVISSYDIISCFVDHTIRVNGYLPYFSLFYCLSRWLRKTIFCPPSLCSLVCFISFACTLQSRVFMYCIMYSFFMKLKCQSVYGMYFGVRSPPLLCCWLSAYTAEKLITKIPTCYDSRWDSFTRQAHLVC